MTVPLPTQYYKRVSDCSTACSPHSATGGSVTVRLPTQCYRRVIDCSTAHTVLEEGQSLFYRPTQCYRRVSDCSTSPHSATGEPVTVLLPT